MLNRLKYIFVLMLTVWVVTVNGQQVKKASNGIFLLRNGMLHTVTHGTFSGDILIKDGKIADMGSSLSDVNAIIIDCTGKHVYPGLIDAGCRLGLSEIGSISLTKDYAEHGTFIPQMKALTAINPNAVAIPVTRVNGVTTVFSKPEGSTFPGTGAVIDLFGYTPEQMSAGSEGVIMEFPATGRRNKWDRRSEKDIETDAEKSLKKINDIWSDIYNYHRMDSLASAQKLVWNRNNAAMDAMLPVVRKEQPLFIEVNAQGDIESAIKWVKAKNIRAVFSGVAEGWRVADKLAAARIPVITGPVLSLPHRENDRYDAAYTNAAKMAKAGVKVALRTNNAENTRNLPFNAGFAAAYGMGVDEALKAVTMNAAEIFGIDQLYGSLDKGKIANLFISDGDPFEPGTQIERLFIRGWDIPLESRQTLLNDEFLHRTPGLAR
ncbi:MAG: amidohydrolase family protein [Saprospiraceae bacterium]|nr:MAG: amidohydrolase [Bacteroidetes bacterium OLB9]MCO6464312.1 amidohydrolase family protein [Saprospiraceae bacterium]